MLTLEQMVQENLGAELRGHFVTDEDGGTLERMSVVIWRRDGEWGTHRALQHFELDECALLWGHYFRGPNAIVDAYKDFNTRIRMEV